MENVSNDVQEAEMEETATVNDEGTEEAVANVSVSQDQEMKTEESTKGKVTFKKIIWRWSISATIFLHTNEMQI